MKASRIPIVAGGTAAILGYGFAVAPKEPRTLDDLLGPAPSTDPDDDNSQLFAGPVVLTQRGPVQAQITVEDGQITWVTILKGGSPHPRTIGIYADAVPVLRERVLAAQDWDIEYASGASFLSPGFSESVRGAMVEAGLSDDADPVTQPGEADDLTADYDRPVTERPSYNPFDTPPDFGDGDDVAVDDDPGDPAAASGTFTGPAVSNIKGEYQLAIVVEDGVVVDVEFLAAGTSATQSVSINANALPILEERILESQDWDVEHVSGASFTSPAMVESAQGAFEDAGLA